MNHEPDAWQEFLSWPGSTSLVTLLSAALLLAGLYGVLEPAIGVEGSTGPRWQVLGTLSAYLAALLSGVWAMCRARQGHPDAIASAVVGASFAVGFGVILQLIAPEQPGLALAAGLAGWLGLLALGHAFGRIAGGAGWGALGLCLGAILAWTTLWPLVLSAVVVAEAVRMPTAGAGIGGTDIAVMQWWTAGWLAQLAIVLAFVVQAGREPEDGTVAVPFLQRRAMRWTLALVTLATAVIAALLQAHIAGIDVAISDAAPAIILLGLIGAELARRTSSAATIGFLAVAAPAWLAAGIDLAGGGPDPSAQFRGEGWAPELAEMLGTAPGAPLLAAVLGAGLALRRRSASLAWGAGAAAVAAVLAWEVRQPLVAEAGILLAGGCGWIAWTAGRSGLAVACAALIASLAPSTLLAGLACGPTLPRMPAGLSSAAALVLLAAAWRVDWVGQTWARIAAWLLGAVLFALAVHLLRGRIPSFLPGGLASGVVLVVAGLLLVAVCAWRRRDAALACGAAPGLVVICWPLLPHSRAWLAVWGAFALLGAGVLLAVRRAAFSRASAAPADA